MNREREKERASARPDLPAVPWPVSSTFPALSTSHPIPLLSLSLFLSVQGRGKTAAQCCHACLGLYKKLRHRKDPVVKVWEASGATKVW